MSLRSILVLMASVLTGAAAFWPVPDEAMQLEDAAAVMQEQLLLAQAQLEKHTLQLAARSAQASGEELWSIPPADPRESMLVIRGSDAVYWSGQAPLDDPDLDSLHTAHLRLADGIYLHAVATTGSVHVHGVRRVWYQPPFENRYLARGFDTDLRPGPGIVAALDPGMGPVVRDASGEVMFRLALDPAMDDDAPPLARPTLALFAVVALLAAWWLTVVRLHPLRAMALFLLPLIALRLLTLMLPTWAALSALPLFDPSHFGASFLMPSLGDLVLNSLLLLTLAGFIHRLLPQAAPPRHPWAMAWCLLVVLMAGAMALNAAIISLVRDSTFSLDLFRIQGFTPFSWTAIGCISLLLLAWMLLADAFLQWCRPLPHAGRGLLWLLVVTLLLLGIHHLGGVYDTILSIWPAVVLVLLVTARRDRGRFLSVLLLVAAPAFLTAHVLNRETLRQMDHERPALAENAIAGDDPVIELLFREASDAIGSGSALRELLPADSARNAGRSPAVTCSSADLDHSVRQVHFTGYWDRYDVRLHLYAADGTIRCSTAPDAPPTWEQIRARFQQGVPTAGDTTLRSVHRPGEAALYIGEIPLHDAQRHQLLVELKPRLIADGLGFPELLLAGARTGGRRTDHYSTARYERGALTESTGAYPFPVTWHDAVPPDGMQRHDRGYDLFAYGDLRRTLVVLGLRTPTALDHFTTFSYLFTLWAVLGGLVLLIRAMHTPRPLARFGLAAKLRTGILLFSAISLVLFAMGTRSALDNRSEQRSSRAMKDRARGVIAELRQTLRSESGLERAMTPYLDHLLTRFSNVFYTDLSLYAPDGSLLATSREQVFNTGLLPRRMDPVAYREVAVRGRSSFVQEETIGTARFRASYMPFRNDQGTVLAYLAMPYFARQTETDQERVASYVAVVNLFTILFVLSGIAAALITQWTIRPLLMLRRGLERIDLGSRNEPLVYAGRDELGELVLVYNRKVEELRESAEKLARSERESAWKEMARQVAHEIKNPLTPMKLNIQHFQRTWDPEAPNARERLDRFSNNLVEQIDVLSRIAGEFSHFAQMPPAHPTELDLAEVADAAVHLFANTPGCHVQFRTTGPFPVVADREHLLRTFNNLIKNAQQAIPEGRDGLVQVLLYRTGDEAIAEVRDNGTGIAPDMIDHVFVPRFTTKSSGMGLGLPLVKRMVENAGGRVWFETEEGRGTRFFVGLPMRPDKEPLV